MTGSKQDSSKCYVCETLFDEKNILLCDGWGCTRECHFYCAGLDSIPDGSWYCNACSSAHNFVRSHSPTQASQSCVATVADEDASEVVLQRYFEHLDQNRKALGYGRDYLSHAIYSEILARRMLMKRDEVLPHETKQERFDASELQPLSANNVLGCSIRLLCPLNGKIYYGRIISRRNLDTCAAVELSESSTRSVYDGEEFLVRFSEGAQGFKRALVRWLVLEQHVVQVAGDLLWARPASSSDMELSVRSHHPAQLFHRSRLEMLSMEGIRSQQIVFFRLPEESFNMEDVEVASFANGRERFCKGQTLDGFCFDDALTRVEIAQVTSGAALAQAELDERKRIHYVNAESYKKSGGKTTGWLALEPSSLRWVHSPQADSLEPTIDQSLLNVRGNDSLHAQKAPLKSAIGIGNHYGAIPLRTVLHCHSSLLQNKCKKLVEASLRSRMRGSLVLGQRRSRKHVAVESLESNVIAEAEEKNLEKNRTFEQGDGTESSVVEEEDETAKKGIVNHALEDDVAKLLDVIKARGLSVRDLTKHLEETGKQKLKLPGNDVSPVDQSSSSVKGSESSTVKTVDSSRPFIGTCVEVSDDDETSSTAGRNDLPLSKKIDAESSSSAGSKFDAERQTRCAAEAEAIISRHSRRLAANPKPNFYNIGNSSRLPSPGPTHLRHLPLTRNPVKGRWTKAEEIRLEAAVEETKQWVPDLLTAFNNNQPAARKKRWQIISRDYFVGTRTPDQCQARWERVVQPGLVKGNWTAEEDDAIRDCIENGMTKWCEIAKFVPGRVGKQCRERWHNHLSPTLKKGPWTTEEDELLMKAQADLGNSWTKIAKLIPGRSENDVKNRWNSAFHKRGRKPISTGPRKKRKYTRRRQLGQPFTPIAVASAATVEGSDEASEPVMRPHATTAPNSAV